jgi:predicted ABC-class ATPase
MQAFTSTGEVVLGVAPLVPFSLNRGVTLIQGGTGSGKTNLLAHLAQAYKESGDEVLRYANPCWDGEREIEPFGIVRRVLADIGHLAGSHPITCLIDDLLSAWEWENARQAAEELGALQDFARDNRINLVVATVGLDGFTDKLANNSDTVVAMDPFRRLARQTLRSSLDQRLLVAAEKVRHLAPSGRESGWFIKFEGLSDQGVLGRAPLFKH